jgi:hypothetical protein
MVNRLVKAQRVPRTAGTWLCTLRKVLTACGTPITDGGQGFLRPAFSPVGRSVKLPNLWAESTYVCVAGMGPKTCFDPLLPFQSGTMNGKFEPRADAWALACSPLPQCIRLLAGLAGLCTQSQSANWQPVFCNLVLLGIQISKEVSETARHPANLLPPIIKGPKCLSLDLRQIEHVSELVSLGLAGVAAGLFNGLGGASAEADARHPVFVDPVYLATNGDLVDDLDLDLSHFEPKACACTYALSRQTVPFRRSVPTAPAVSIGRAY